MRALGRGFQLWRHGFLQRAPSPWVRWYSYQPPTEDPSRAAFSFCISQVKKYDYEAYMWCIGLPKVRTYLL